MKIVITTGIFEPEAGGPATFAPRLGKLLSENGWDVTVVTYSDEAQYDFDTSYRFKLVRIVRTGKIANRWRFFRALMKEARDADLIYTLDWFAAGLPAALAARSLGKPYVARVGGDYAWEQQYCEREQEPLPLRDFYERGVYRRGRYRFFYYIVRYVLSGARHVIFNSQQQRDLYARFYGLALEHTSIVSNAVPVKEFAEIRRKEPSHEIVFWGRFNGMKNIGTLVRAFAAASLPASYKLVLIGDGPQKERIIRLVRDFHMEHRVEFLPRMRQHDVLQRVKDARFFVLPSWTDISPNQVYEALAIGLPFIVTKENFLAIGNDLPMTIDPSVPEELTHALEMLTDEEKYQKFASECRSISFEHGWHDVLLEHIDIFKHSLGIGATRVLQIGADRSKRGILYEHSDASHRQSAYGACFDSLDIIGFSLRQDSRSDFSLAPATRVHPTDSVSRLFYGLDALEIARSIQPSVVSAQDPFETGLVGLVISRIKGVPLHVQVHTDFLSRGYRSSGLMHRVRVTLARFVLLHAARIRVVSERIKTSIEKEIRPEAHITVLPIYTDISHFSRAPVDRELVRRYVAFTRKVLMVSRLEPEKNVALAIRSFATAAPKDACLIIVGSGSQRAGLDRIVRELKLAGRVFFEDSRDVAPFYKIADVVLVSSRYEGYGLVVVEALAAGKPVISTDVGIAREAGAIITTSSEFADALARWFKSGPRFGHLKAYPYKNFDEYVRAYCDDIRACVMK